MDLELTQLLPWNWGWLRSVQLFSGLFGAGFGLVALLLYIFQNHIVYPSNLPPGARTTYIDPSSIGWDYEIEELFFDTPDGERLQAYLVLQPQSDTVPTILFFHGNAGNISYRLPNIRDMFERLKCNVFIVSYRGYGKSSGVPSEHGLQMDAEAALDVLKSRQDIDRHRIVVFGRSLGGAVAIYLAAKRGLDIAGLIVENSFTSIPDMARTIIPFARYVFPTFLCLNKWNSELTISEVSVPVLFVSGQKDELVPKAMMESLYRACSSSHKQMARFPRGDHMNTPNQPFYYAELAKFLSDHA